MTSKSLAPHAFVLPPHVATGTTSTRCANCGLTNRAKAHTEYVRQQVKIVMDTYNEVAGTRAIPVDDSMERAAAALNSPDLPGVDTVGDTEPSIAGYMGKLSSGDDVIAANRKALLSMGCSEAQAKEFSNRTFAALPKWLRNRIKRMDLPKQAEPRKLKPAAGQLAFYLDPHRFRPMVVDGTPVPLHVTRKAEYEAKKHKLAPLTAADLDRKKRNTPQDQLVGGVN